jgi:uncharacterized protein (DUF952 family)
MPVKKKTTKKSKKSTKKAAAPKPEPVDSKLAWQQACKEAAYEAQAQAFDEQQKELDVAYDATNVGEKTRYNTQEAKDDWEHLRRVAKVQFPEGVRHIGLSPNNRMVAIAHCLGWTQGRIARASGLNQGTISKWLKRPDMKVFIDEFNLKQGTEDVMTKFTELEYKAVQCVNGILSDPDSSDSMKRLKLDASKWVFDRSRGKPNQPVEHKGEAVRQLMDTMKEIGKISLSDEEEKELFETEVG